MTRHLRGDLAGAVRAYDAVLSYTTDPGVIMAVAVSCYRAMARFEAGEANAIDELLSPEAGAVAGLLPSMVAMTRAALVQDREAFERARSEAPSDMPWTTSSSSPSESCPPPHRG